MPAAALGVFAGAFGTRLLLSCPCRSEMGVLGRVCRHCKLDEDMRTWEARLFQLSVKALATGTQVGVDMCVWVCGGAALIAE